MSKIFKVVAILEGISYLILFSNMLFVKPNHIELYKTLLFPIGMSHGILFIAYLYLSAMIKGVQGWSYKDLAIVWFASILPFATFYIEKKYLKNT